MLDGIAADPAQVADALADVLRADEAPATVAVGRGEAAIQALLGSAA